MKCTKASAIRSLLQQSIGSRTVETDAKVLRASAIVMQTGGFLSHGAIVAREFGIPAVVNIPGIFDQVRDGDWLVVNGDEGTVTRVEK